MSTIIVATILVGTVIAICLLLIAIANKQKIKTMNQLLDRFSRLGTTHNLCFSSQEVLNKSVIGIDGIRRKVLVLTQVDDTSFTDRMLDLEEVKSCTLKKHYVNINAGDAKNKRLEAHLETVSLQFGFFDEKDRFEIVFYNHIDNNIYQLPGIEEKANHWQQIFTKMLGKPLQKTISANTSVV